MLAVSLKKTDYDTKINEIEKKLTDHHHDKYSPIPEFNTFTAKRFVERLVQANLITKTDFDNKLISLNKKINSSKTKYLLNKNEPVKVNLLKVNQYIMITTLKLK